MKLSIVTINRNNSAGLEKTMQSVVNQTFNEFEYIVIDGASTDNSVEVIKRYVPEFGERFKWGSEPDSGIYNAMNKGICKASGDYIQILNSGDCLAAPDVTERMLKSIEGKGFPTILYGNMVKCFPDGHRMVDKCFAGQEITMLGMYSSTLNHDPAYIRRDLYDKYGYYDEGLKIVSDWKWYLQAIIFGNEKPVYVNLDVTLFDMTGISENAESKQKIKDERNKVLKEWVPSAYLHDYERYSNDIYLMRRIRRHPWAFKLVRLVERSLFKLEKWQNAKKNMQSWG